MEGILGNKIPSKHSDFRIGVYTYPSEKNMAIIYAEKLNKISLSDVQNIREIISNKVEAGCKLRYPFIVKSWKLTRRAPIRSMSITSIGKINGLGTGSRQPETPRVNEAMLYSDNDYKILSSSSIKNTI